MFGIEREIVKSYIKLLDDKLPNATEEGELYHYLVYKTLIYVTTMAFISFILSWLFSFPVRWILEKLVALDIGTIAAIVIKIGFPFTILMLILGAVLVHIKIRDSSVKEMDNWVWFILFYNAFFMSLIMGFYGILNATILFLSLFVLVFLLSLFFRYIKYNLSCLIRWVVLLSLGVVTIFLFWFFGGESEQDVIINIIFIVVYLYIIDRNIRFLRKLTLQYQSKLNNQKAIYYCSITIYIGFYILWLELLQDLEN